MNLTAFEKVACIACILTALAVVGVVWWQYGPLFATVTAFVLTVILTVLVFQSAELLESRRKRAQPSTHDQFVDPDN